MGNGFSFTKNRLLLLAIIFIIVLQFSWDLVVPNGIADWVWYFIPMFLSGWLGRRYFSYGLAAVITGLMLVAFHVAPEGIDPQLALLSRLVGICGLWVCALLIAFHKDTKGVLQRSERALRMVSECNQVLVRAEAEDELLKKICQAIVDIGGYRMAWVGFANDDAPKSVRVATLAGFEDGYLDQAKITWDENSESGRGPTGIALRTGEVVVSNDFQNDPLTTPWHKKAAKRGYAASICLPLKNAGKNFGVLVFYAGEKNAFNANEVKLLMELADDLAFGIHALRARTAQRTAERTLLEKVTLLDFLLFNTPAIIYSLHATPDHATPKLAVAFISPNVEKILGYPPEKFTRDAGFWFDRLHPDDAAKAVEGLQADATSDLISREYRFRHADGSYRWMRDEMRAIRQGHEQPDGYVGHWFDITERRQAQVKLCEREEIFSNIVNQAADAIVLLDLEGQFVEFNTAAHEMHGYTRNEFARFRITDLQAEHSPELIRQNIEKIRQSSGLAFETKHRHRDGHLQAVRVNAKLIQLHGKDYMTAVWSDITEAKQMAAALRQTNETLEKRIAERTATLHASEERLELAFRAAQDGIWDWNIETDEVFYSSRYKRMLGFEDSELEHHAAVWKRLLHPEDLPRALQLVQDVLAGKADYVMEFRMRHKDGQYVDILSRGFPLRREPDGPIVRIVGTHYDLSERKRAAKELERARNTLLEAQQISHLGSFEYLAATQATFWSDEEYRIYGLDPAASPPTYDEMLANCVHPDDAPIVHTAFTKAMQNRSGYEHEHRIVRSDGSVRWVYNRAYAHFDEHGELVRLVGTTLDITERKLADEALRKSEQDYRQLVETATEGVWRLDRQASTTFVNRQMAEMLGYTTGEMLGRSLFDFMDDTVRPDAEACFRRRLLGEAEQHDICFRRKDGQPVWAIVSGCPQLDAAGQVTAVVALVNDITHRKQVEQELQKYQGQLEQLVRERTRKLELEIAERKAAQTALIESDNRLRAIGDNLPESFVYQFALLPDGTFKFWHISRAIEQLVGLTVAAVKNDASLLLSRLAPEFQQPYAAAMEQSRQSLQDFAMEIKFQNAGGEWHWLRVRSRPIRTSDGATVWDGVATDITGQKQIQDALQKREEIFSSIVGQACDAIGLVDVDTMRFVEFNQAAHEMLGYTREEFTGFGPASIDSQLTPEQIRQNLMLILEHGSAVFETQHRHRNGELLDVRVSARRLQLQEKYYITAIWSDVTAARRQETELRKLSLAVEQNPASIVITDPQGNIEYVNRRFTEVTGYTPGEVCGQNPRLLKSGQQTASVYEELWREIAAGRDWRGELVNRKKDGSLHTELVVIAPVKNAQGVITHFVAMKGDITGAKQAGEALRVSEERLRNLFEQASDGIFIIDDQNHFVSVNKRGLKIFGYSLDEFLKMGVSDVIAPQERSRLNNESQLMLSGTPHLAEWIHVRKDGTQFTAEVSARRLDSNSYMAIVRDVTERKQSEQHQRRLATAVEQSGETIVITDTEGTILYANPAFEKTTGYTLAEAVGKNPRLLKSGKQDPVFYRAMWETLARGETWKGHFINQRKDGQLYEEDATISPISDEQGRIVSYVAAKRDVTREMQLEAQFRQAQKMEAVGTLAGGIAHDFNNILMAVFGYSNLLLNNPTLNVDGREMVDEILIAAERAKDLVQQILTFSRQREQKRQILRLEPVVKEATKFLRSSLPVDIQAELNLSPDAPPVLADPTQIYQVVLNLATNAFHAMEGKPGRLTIGLDTFTPDENLIAANPKFRRLTYARLTIADTGQGMDRQTLERIFEPFFTTKPVGKGTGLGLAVVHGIIQSHDAVITVESKPGEGTTFSLYFPSQKPETTGVGPAISVLPVGRGQKILLVDDETALTTMLERMLKVLKYQPTVFNHPHEALEHFRKEPDYFDLVITDLAMPGLNGHELARQIHALRPNVPVVLFSGFAPELSRENLSTAGIREIVGKPISLPEMARTLHRTLSP